MVTGDQLEWHEFKYELSSRSSCFNESSAACSGKSVLVVVSWQVVLCEPVAVILSQKLRAQVLLDKREHISLIYLHLKKWNQNKT